ncbi:ArsA family ATPase [Streptomyces sp. NBC_01167]|uniref:ArsA family ATPase n=1 Tax=Streptomyces sp. NBC_01167 TaxID=2903756 RepID=UPI00386DD808|nr:ArsA family ATPase [Streptomyces sp. NBC_01167]
MRTVLVTGLGGAGRTTVAAATAHAAAKRGERVLFLSTDPGEVLGIPVTGSPDAPGKITDGLWAARVDTGADFRAEFLSLQERSATALDLLGAARLEEAELTELPGSEQFALLRALTVAASGDWDTAVVDLPPLRETIALLALPEQLRRYLRRLLPQERQAARALRPVLAQLAGVPMPAQWLYATAARWDAELALVQSVIESGDTALRVVAEPGPAAAAALRTARSGLALHGLRVEALLANRVLPRHSADTWLASLAAQQEKCLHEWSEVWLPGTALLEVPHAGRDPRGLDDLALLGDLTLPDGGGPQDGADAGAGHGSPRQRIEDRRTDDGILVWTLELPGAVKGDVGLVRRGDELMLSVGPFRRILPLPSVLRRCTVAGAALADGVLRVRFAPDPQLWPHGH